MKTIKTQKAKERILDVAEELFSQQGYEPVSFRQIATHADVHISQIVYHFQNKSLLVRGIIMRRAVELNRERLSMLAYYRRAVGDEKPDVSAVLRAFLDPFFEKRIAGDQGWMNYSAFISRIVWDPKASPFIEEAFDDVAKEFVDALKDAFPGVSEEKIHWGFQFALASMNCAGANNARIRSLSDGKVSGKDLDETFKLLLPFLSAGFKTF